nr:MAG TPA: hypothetical protein [Caudoviricetes sp.]
MNVRRTKLWEKNRVSPMGMHRGRIAVFKRRPSNTF